MSEITNNVGNVVNIPIEKLKKASWNPQVQSSETFNNLVQEIEEDGFDEPLLVIVDPDDADMYIIIAGNHRYDGGKVTGMSELPCIIKDWTEDEAKIKAVRRNVIHGDLDERRLSSLVNSMKERKKLTEDEISKKMGFDSREAFYRKYKAEDMKKKEEDRKEAYSHKDIPKELTMVDNVSVVLTEIFGNYEGDSIDRSFLFFMHKKRNHLIVQCDDKLAKTVSKAVESINNAGLDAAEFFDEVLKKAVKEMEKSPKK